MAAPSPHAVRAWRAAWQGRVRVALNEANRALKDWEVGAMMEDREERGIGNPAASVSAAWPTLTYRPLFHFTQDAVRHGGLAAAGVGNAAMQEE